MVLYTFAAILLLFGVHAYLMLGHGKGVENPENVPGMGSSR